MKTSHFKYNLPEELIALEPMAQRSASRLLNLNDDSVAHRMFKNLPDLLAEGDVLVFNNSKVVPAKLEARRLTGGHVDILVERVLESRKALAYVGASNTPKAGTKMHFANGVNFEVTGRKENFFYLELASSSWDEVMAELGQMPLPPYIKRDNVEADKDRYQTVYAQEKGSVAAPTAGLHFDEAILQRLKDKGVQFANVTLHVGSGTFMPLRGGNALEHKMHAERIEITQSNCDIVNNRKGRLVAVGTTALRSIESAWGEDGKLHPYNDESNIFIYPGKEVKSADMLITNFHLPETTLLMLVCAFAGYAPAMNAYQEAIKEKYRFFSYGDAMLIAKNMNPDIPVE